MSMSMKRGLSKATLRTMCRDDHEVVPNFEEENMEYHDEGDEGDAEDDIGIQHDTNMTTGYRPPTDSFYANTWEDMVDPSRLEIPFVFT